MTLADIVIFVFGKMNEDDMECIIFGCTGYPSFWRTDSPMREFYYSLKHAKRSLKKGYSIDDIYCGLDTLHQPTIDKINKLLGG